MPQFIDYFCCCCMKFLMMNIFTHIHRDNFKQGKKFIKPKWIGWKTNEYNLMMDFFVVAENIAPKKMIDESCLFFKIVINVDDDDGDKSDESNEWIKWKIQSNQIGKINNLSGEWKKKRQWKNEMIRIPKKKSNVFVFEFVFLFHSKLTMMISIWQSPQCFFSVKERENQIDWLNEKKSKTTNGSHLINQFIQCKSYFKFIKNKQRKHTTHQNKTKKFWFFFENNKNEQLNDNNNNFCSMNSSGKNYEFFVLKGTSTILHTFLFVKL